MTERNKSCDSGDPIESLLNIGIAAVEDERRVEEVAAEARSLREDLRSGQITVEQARRAFDVVFERLIAGLGGTTST